MQRDSAFLSELGLMDYSLILAVEENIDPVTKSMVSMHIPNLVNGSVSTEKSESRQSSKDFGSSQNKHWKLKSKCGKYIFHVGLIDYLQFYNWRKRSERFSKVFLSSFEIKKQPMDLVSNNNQSIAYNLSVIQPRVYQRRFASFFKTWL